MSTNCPCDAFVHPQALDIPPAQTRIRRQIARFAGFRRAMLNDVRTHAPLASWDARGRDDLGVLLLELWSYAADVLAFYDEVIAHECYVRTARRRPSLRKLVELLGYLPRPAVAASVELSLLAEGRRPVRVPARSAFLSGGFEGEPPQTFETEAEDLVHPLTNRWTLEAPRRPTIGKTAAAVFYNRLLLDPATAAARAEDRVLVRTSTGDPGAVRRIAKVEDVTGEDGESYTRVELDAYLPIVGTTPLADIELLRPTQTAGLWTLSVTTPPERGVDMRGTSRYLYLDGLYRQIEPGDRVLVCRGARFRSFSVQSVDEVRRTVSAASTISLGGNQFTIPAVQVPVTRLTLDAALNARKPSGDTETWTNQLRNELTVHHGLLPAGDVTVERDRTLPVVTSAALTGPVETPFPVSEPTRFHLTDVDERGVLVGGAVSFGDARLAIDGSWAPELKMPVAAYGNVVSATRGETVLDEVLGSGDASLPNQSFTLSRSPLTYVAAPSTDHPQGIATTLAVRVNGILWTEAPSFFGRGPREQVYVTRQNDDGETVVTFGDGIRGARLPSGTDNVTADYRFGAGEKSPPAGSITQIAGAVDGLSSVLNPTPAYGGQDAEDRESLRENAPRSALLFGRVISIQDVEAVGAGAPGVRAVRAEWTWDEAQQRAVAKLWYVGSPLLVERLTATLRSMADPTVAIAAAPAIGDETHLSLTIAAERSYVSERVEAGVREALLDPASGLLAPERIGIGRPLFRSRVFEVVQAVAGVEAVLDARLGAAPFAEWGLPSAPGHYLDFETGSVDVSVKEASHGESAA